MDDFRENALARGSLKVIFIVRIFVGTEPIFFGVPPNRHFYRANYGFTNPCAFTNSEIRKLTFPWMRGSHYRLRGGEGPPAPPPVTGGPSGGPPAAGPKARKFSKIPFQRFWGCGVQFVPLFEGFNLCPCLGLGKKILWGCGDRAGAHA